MNETGATACLSCSTVGDGYWSSEGAAHCDQAAATWFMNSHTGEPEACGDGMNCEDAGVTSESVALTNGVYKFSTAATSVYLCPYRDSCRFPNISGAVGQSLCVAGSHGALCSLCGELIKYKTN